MENISLSYREVIPDAVQDEWVEFTFNTGGTQSTLQDIKMTEKAGGFCFQNFNSNHTRNRYIYWRTYNDVLELSEVSLDFNLYRNNLRYKFTDSPVIAVTIVEQERFVTLLVTTVCSLHRMNFPHPDTLADSSSVGGTSSGGGSVSCSQSSRAVSIDYNGAHPFSIFRDAGTAGAQNCSIFLETINSNNVIPHAAASYLSHDGEFTYFALGYESQLMLHVMTCSKGVTVAHELKTNNKFPRLFSNLAALMGKSDTRDADYATSFTFHHINGQLYVMALYRNDKLQLWSTTKFQVVCSINCVREIHQHRLQGPQSNCLRKVNDTSVCVFLSHSTGAEFVCIDIRSCGNNSSMQELQMVWCKAISAPQLDLVNFDVSSTRIWALWSNAEGEFSISNFSFLIGMGLNWVSAAMEPPPDRYCVGTEGMADPREAYCSYIFHPGKFEQSVILKALFMFRRSSMRFDHKPSMNLLKQYVCQAIEDEIQKEIKDYETSDEEYLEISTRLWERFYSCCEQYHLKACQPTGLVILEPIDAVCVVKKSTFSVLRPCETLEHLMLAGCDVDMDVILPVHFEGSESLGKDLITLVTILAQLEKCLPEDVKMDLDKKLYHLEIPNELISNLTEEILKVDPDRNILPYYFLLSIHQQMRTIRNIRESIEWLFNTLRMDSRDPKSVQTHLNLEQNSRHFMSIGVLFGSDIGLSLLSETVRQTALMRFAICRNLLILQQILIDTNSLSIEILELLCNKFMPETVITMQSYYAMVWISETPVNIESTPALESSVHRLQLLNLTNAFGRTSTLSSKYKASPLLRMFLQSKGLYTALSLYADNFQLTDTPTWQNTLLPLTTIVCQLIWPVSNNFLFGEWLLSTCQHIIIEDYVRLLNNWCKWNVYSRQFILAVSLLDCGEIQKAYDLFILSAKGTLTEQFFLMDEPVLRTLMKTDDMENETESNANILYNSSDAALCIQAQSRYYLKVIQLFEQHEVLDCIIKIAEVAIGLLDEHNEQLPIFQSIVFNNHLLLGHYEEAYHSLVRNAELSRRKDCLRQLVITLFSRKRLDLLVKFPYVGLHEEFVNIVESRARSLMMDQNTVYDFLYAFQVSNGNMRKASTIMYEQALRLQLECDDIDALQRRCSSLSICLNALHLIDKRYQWIAKPMIGDESNGVSISDDSMNNTQLMGYDENPHHQVVVLEIKDIRRELLQSEALLLLAEQKKEVNSFLNTGPHELVNILSNYGFYTPALKLAKGFDISTMPIFDSLAGACVRAADETINETWSWLQENDLADLPHRHKATDMAWSLLQQLITDNEAEKSTEIHKVVVNKILSVNAFVPQWLYNSYKLANCSQFLHLFVQHNRLLEAAELAHEMISAMLGAGNEYFSIKHSIAVTNPVMCLPVHTLDLLLHGLKLNARENIDYHKSNVELEELLRKYVETALRTANDKAKMAFQIQTLTQHKPIEYNN